MQVLVKPFNTIYQPFLVISLYSSKAHTSLETTIPGVSLKKHYTFLSSQTFSTKYSTTARGPASLPYGRSPQKAAFLIQASGVR